MPKYKIVETLSTYAACEVQAESFEDAVDFVYGEGVDDVEWFYETDYDDVKDLSVEEIE